MLPENRINTSPDEEEVVERIEVDENEEVEVEDSTGDVNIAAKLPPRGIYAVQWRAGKDENSIYASKTKSEPHRAFVGAALVGAIQDEEWEGTPVYVNHINSLQRRGKPTSDLHHFLNVCGSPAPNKAKVGELVAFVREVLEQEPTGMAEIDWKASYKNSKGEYIDLLTTMEKFPKHYVDENNETTTKAAGGRWDGTYIQVVANPETGEDVQAQLWVRKHLTQVEANKEKAKARTA